MNPMMYRWSLFYKLIKKNYELIHSYSAARSVGYAKVEKMNQDRIDIDALNKYNMPKQKMEIKK